MEKKIIGVKQVLQHLKDGMTRDEIAVHYGITRGECKILFQHKDLKNRKTIKKPSFSIVDDEEGIVRTLEEETTQEKTVEEVVGEHPVTEKEAYTGFGSNLLGKETGEVKEEEKFENAPKATWD